MGLDIEWVSADRTVLDAVTDGPRDLLAKAILAAAGQSPLLDIDPYTTTEVSPSPQLTAAIRRFRDQQTDLDTSLHLGRLLGIAAAAEGVRGSFLRFIGD